MTNRYLSLTDADKRPETGDERRKIGGVQQLNGDWRQFVGECLLAVGDISGANLKKHLKIFGNVVYNSATRSRFRVDVIRNLTVSPPEYINNTSPVRRKYASSTNYHATLKSKTRNVGTTGRLYR